MNAEHERRLLLELAECRRFILETTRRPDGLPWDLSRPNDEFRRMVRGLADGSSSVGTSDDHGEADGGQDRDAESLRRMARRYEEIRAALAMANSRLVAYIARRFGNRGIAPADLMQEGFCGLLEAIDRFDPINATRLATYATWWIRQAIQRAIADGSYAVRLSPRQVRRLARSLRQFADHASAGDDRDSGRTGTGQAIGTRPDLDETAYPTHHELASWTELAAIRPRISLDAVSHHDDCTPLAEILALAPEDNSAENEFAESVGMWLNELNQREQLVVRMRFGLDGCSHHSLSQIGAVLAVSKERVRQIQERALKKLREAAGYTGPAPEMAQEVAEPAGVQG